MKAANSKTKRFPDQRSDQKTIYRQQQMLDKYFGPLKQVFESVSEIVLIINHNRQIVFFNSVFSCLSVVDDPDNLHGMRPGEALGCVNSAIHPSGCGSSEFCTQCGAVKSMLPALRNKAGLQECRILRSNNSEALDLLVRTTPLEIRNHFFGIMAITDISHEKRRMALERVFFHDVLNTAQGIRVFAKMLSPGPEGKKDSDYRQHIIGGINQLIGQINAQKTLLSAENNELEPKKEDFDGYVTVGQVVDTLAGRFPGHRICVKPSGQKIILRTDPRLFRRVLENMIINALEASRPENEVSISCKVKNGCAQFCVYNKAHIPKEVQVQIFQRSFSTKGPGRGLGTYSMKLLSQRYLNGTVSFKSSEKDGTTFIASYPLKSDTGRI